MSKVIEVRDLLHTGGYIPYNRQLAKVLTNDGYLFLAELISRYQLHQKRNDLDKDGEFFYTVPACQENINLGEKPQNKAIAILETFALIKKRNKNGNKRYFSIQWDNLKAFLSTLLGVSKEESSEVEETPEKTQDQPLPAEESRSTQTEEPSNAVQEELETPNGSSSNTVFSYTELSKTKNIKHNTKTLNLSSSSSLNKPKKHYVVKDEEILSDLGYKVLYDFFTSRKMDHYVAMKYVREVYVRGLRGFSIDQIRATWKCMLDWHETKEPVNYPVTFFANGLALRLKNDSLIPYVTQSVSIPEEQRNLTRPSFDYLNNQPLEGIA